MLEHSREEVHTMRKHTPALHTLDMRHNPWAKVILTILACLVHPQAETVT